MRAYLGGVVSLLLGLGACSSVVNEREQLIRFETPYADAAHCVIEDRRDYHWNAYSTPDVVLIEKGYPPLRVTCQKEGFHTTVLEIGQRYEPKIAGDFIADKVGYVLPAWQNSAKQYPETITVWMRPMEFESLEAMETWERGLWQFLRDEETRLVATDKTLKGYASRMYTRMDEAWDNFDPPLRRVKRAKPLFERVAPPPWKKELRKNEVWIASPEGEEPFAGKKTWEKKFPKKIVEKTMPPVNAEEKPVSDEAVSESESSISLDKTGKERGVPADPVDIKEVEVPDIETQPSDEPISIVPSKSKK